MAPFNGPPLLSTASDPMYAGPMKNISYTYATGLNGDNSTPVVGQIRYEKSADGQTVSNLGMIVSGRVETKGDGSSRYFTFPANGYLLSSWSDLGSSGTPTSNMTRTTSSRRLPIATLIQRTLFRTRSRKCYAGHVSADLVRRRVGKTQGYCSIRLRQPVVPRSQQSEPLLSLQRYGRTRQLYRPFTSGT